MTALFGRPGDPKVWKVQGDQVPQTTIEAVEPGSTRMRGVGKGKNN